MRWPLAAGLLAVVIVVLLMGGVVLARRAQSADTGPASPTAAATSLPEVSPTSLATAPPQARAAIASTPRAQATPATAATDGANTSDGASPPGAPATAVTDGANASDGTTSGAQPTSAAAATPPAATPPATPIVNPLSVVLLNGTPQVVPGGPTAEATPTQWYAQTGDVSADLSGELQTAYQHFWDVRAQALLDLDPGPLSGVMDGEALQNETAALDQLRAENQSQQIEVQHHIQIRHATSEDATIFDTYVSRTVLVDLETGEAQPPSPYGTWRLAYHFRKLNGAWKVVEAVQLAYS